MSSAGVAEEKDGDDGTRGEPGSRVDDEGEDGDDVEVSPARDGIDASSPDDDARHRAGTRDDRPAPRVSLAMGRRCTEAMDRRACVPRVPPPALRRARTRSCRRAASSADPRGALCHRGNLTRRDRETRVCVAAQN